MPHTSNTAASHQRPSYLSRALIGMVHVGATPGSPRAALSIAHLAANAAAEAKILKDAGFDAVMIENMHDRPYVNAPHAATTVAAMTAVALAVRSAVGDTFPLGIQILSRGEKEALAVALATNFQFIRCENFVFSHTADEGQMVEAAAGPLLRYRQSIGASHIRVLTDIQKKHASHAQTSDLSVADWAHGAEFFLSDGLIVTGPATGVPTSTSDLSAAKHAVGGRLPILVGSGATPQQLATLFTYADAVIVGSALKHGGHWENTVDPARAAAFVAAK